MTKQGLEFIMNLFPLGGDIMKNRRGVMSKMKVGILGAGRIAGIMADTLQRMDTEIGRAHV